jgi:signal transduction histidine kinase
MPVDHLKALAAERSDDLGAAVERCTEALRRGEVRDADLLAVCEQLVKLVKHDDRLVRRAVARAAQHLPDPYFERIVTPLAKDKNTWVKGAVEESITARSTQRRQNVEIDDKAAHIKQLAREIEQKYDRGAMRLADELSDCRTEFFARGLNHEFKALVTNLQIVRADTRRLLQEPHLDRERLLANWTTESSVEQLMLSVVSTACDVSEVVPSKYKTENLRLMVAQAIDLVSARFDGRFAPTIEIDEALVLDVDRGKVMQALLNILQNAAEASPSDRAIKIRVTAKTAKAGTQVVIEFADEGCGIGADALPHVYAPFGTSKTKEPRVRGLGLLNVQRMIERAHGGEVDLDSKKGVGTTVKVTLPRRQQV